MVPGARLPDQASQDRLEEVRKELAALEEQLRPLEMRYQAEKRILDELRELQRKRDELKTKLAEAENRMDLAMVADIKCAAFPASPVHPDPAARPDCRHTLAFKHLILCRKEGC